MITYGHEKYIHEAVIGVLNQTTSFEFELVISNDASPDNTDKIIREIIDTHPRGNIISYYLNNKNEGMQHNFYETLNKCQGKYIALCEGDDYWTNNLKLQKQFELLESNLDASICFHNVLKRHRDGKVEIINNMIPPPYRIEDILSIGRPCHTCTIMARKSMYTPNLHLLTINENSADLAFIINLALNGPLIKLDKVMATYRIHDSGITNNFEWRKNLNKSNLNLLNIINKYTNFKYDKYIKFRTKKILLDEITNTPSLRNKVKRIFSLCSIDKLEPIKKIDLIIISFARYVISKTRLYKLKRLMK